MNVIEAPVTTREFVFTPLMKTDTVFFTKFVAKLISAEFPRRPPMLCISVDSYLDLETFCKNGLCGFLEHTDSK